MEVSCIARVPSSSGRQGQGQTYFSSPPTQPLKWVIGSGKVSSHLLSSMLTCKIMCLFWQQRWHDDAFRVFHCKFQVLFMQTGYSRRCGVKKETAMLIFSYGMATPAV